MSLMAVSLGLSAGNAFAGKQENSLIGKRIKNVASLRNPQGYQRALHSFQDYKAIVIVFTGVDCPLAKRYIPRLKELDAKYREKGVQFLAVNANQGEDADQVAGHALENDIPFPTLKDFGHQLADALHAERTPEAFVLDADYVLRYRGRIDDQYGVGFQKHEPTKEELVAALDEVLAGEEVTVAEAPMDGCHIDRESLGYTPKKDVTYAKEVSRVLQKNCQGCHRPGEVAPFALMNYDDAVAKAHQIKEVVLERRMPPWHADPRYGKFKNTRRMSDEDVSTVASWVEAGVPMGDKANLPSEVDYGEGWTIGTPELIVEMPEEYEVPAEGVIPYQHYELDVEFEEDRWVQAAEVQPGNELVVHHVVVYISGGGGMHDIMDEDGNISTLVIWAPGDLPSIYPEGTALKVRKGSRLVMEMHYTPTGKVEKDRSRVGVIFAKEPPERPISINVVANMMIDVAPHSQHHVEHSFFTFQEDARILSFMPHLHWRGKDFHYEATYPDGKKEVLLSVPRWDFNWQAFYWLEEPLSVPKGTKIHCTAHWDNSRNNPYNPDPSESVGFGLQTWDEMMLGWVTYVPEKPGLGPRPKGGVFGNADNTFDQMDRNQDGFVSVDEFPKRMRGFIPLMGVDVSKPMDRETFKALLEKFAEQRKKMRGTDEDGGGFGGRRGFGGPRARAPDRSEGSKSD
jgi:mono/diheme cytochrome c family protein